MQQLDYKLAREKERKARRYFERYGTHQAFQSWERALLAVEQARTAKR